MFHSKGTKIYQLIWNARFQNSTGWNSITKITNLCRVLRQSTSSIFLRKKSERLILLYHNHTRVYLRTREQICFVDVQRRNSTVGDRISQENATTKVATRLHTRGSSIGDCVRISRSSRLPALHAFFRASSSFNALRSRPNNHRHVIAKLRRASKRVPCKIRQNTAGRIS